MAKVFILEDLPDRQKAFKEKFKEHQLTICDNVNDSKQLLLDNQYDLICLDHDLGGEAFVDSNYYNTGYTLAKFILENNIKSKVVIHSLNPVGAKNIKFILPEAEIYPGFWSVR